MSWLYIPKWLRKYKSSEKDRYANQQEQDRKTHIEMWEIDRHLNKRAIELIDESLRKYGTIDISQVVQDHLIERIK